MAMSNTNPAEPTEEEWEPEDWLANLEADSRAVPLEHGPDERYERAGTPDYHERVMAGRASRAAAHRAVTTLAGLRRAVGMTQVQVAQDWGTTQPAVSRLESDPARAEVASLAAYVRALGGHLAIDAEIGGEHYRYELV